MDNKPKAIVFMLICAFAFSGVGAMVKLAGDVPVFEKVFQIDFWTGSILLNENLIHEWKN